MLTELAIRNVVLFEDARLTFAGGLNVISGETGAGKSLLATALSAVLGETRLSADSIREGADTATITAVFELSPKRLRTLREATGLELPDADAEGIILERTASRSGRGRCAICGVPTAGAAMREVGGHLVDLFAQNEHVRVREPAYQCDLLDAYGKLTPQAAEVATAHARARELLDRLEGGDTERQRLAEEAARIRFHLGEYDALAPDPKTDASLDDTIGTLEHADAIRAFCVRAVEELHEDDASASTLLGNLSIESSRLATWSHAVAEAAVSLENALTAIDDAVRTLRDTAEALDTDPAELDRLNDRRQALRELCRKHHCELTELPSMRAKLEQRLQDIEGMDMDTAALEQAFAAAGTAFIEAALSLRDKRRTAATRLAKGLRRHLEQLGMEHAEFEARIEPLVPEKSDTREAVRAGTARGLDSVSFRLRPNPGEAWSLVSESASGGETSRTLLAICTVLASAHRCDTLFFDEIDAGVGGRLGDAIGRHLEELARDRQVIAITHLPQVACHGARHLCVRKRVERGRTRTEVAAVEGEARVEEVAAMIRGDESRETTMRLAREMLGDRP